MLRFYPAGRPFWRIFAALGCTLKVRVELVRDEQTGRHIATSTDLRGLVCEASTSDAIRDDARRAANALIAVAYYPKSPPPHVVEWVHR